MGFKHGVEPLQTVIVNGSDIISDEYNGSTPDVEQLTSIVCTMNSTRMSRKRGLTSTESRGKDYRRLSIFPTDG